MTSYSVTIAGVTFPDVPAVDLTKSGGGTARYTNVADTTAIASDVASGKTFYTAAGVRTTGTASGGGGITPAEEKDVNFIDYDGTIVYSYTKAEFANLSALPANPSHTGLTSQGWNWTKQQITTQLTAMPDQKVWVGQMYKTTSGKTEIDIELNNAELLTPYLKIAVNGTVEVDWGDGSAKDTVTGTSLTSNIYAPHTYAGTGNYTISIEVKSGSFTFYSSYILSYTNSTNNASRRYNSSVVAVRLGDGIPRLEEYAFGSCYSLQSVTIPSGVTQLKKGAFNNCYSLQSVTIPSEVTSIGTDAFRNCYSLQSAIFLLLTKSLP